MFTPPSSPLPSPSMSKEASDDYQFPVEEKQPMSSVQVKRRIGRRWKWTAIMAPIILALITLSTRYITHPAIFDVLSNASQSSDLWTPHKRHIDVRADASPSSASSGSPSSSTPSPTQTLSNAIPTVPTLGDVPTPFPQPFDSNIQKNFSSLSCYSFFANMTNTAPFRSCRPFSLLLQSSSSLIQAQTNLTLLNEIVWGTCQTTIALDQCSANMGWFADNLQVACAQDLLDRNANAVDTLTALQAYDLMNTAGCLSDPTTNSYCYINAVHNSNPSDLYIYQLPLGLGFPDAATPTCSTCAKSLLGIYAAALQNSASAPKLSALMSGYNNAASLASKTCGSSYAKSVGNDAGHLKSRVGAVLGSLALFMFIQVGCL